MLIWLVGSRNFEEESFPLLEGSFFLLIIVILVINPDHSRLDMVHYFLANFVGYTDSRQVCACCAAEIMRGPGFHAEVGKPFEVFIRFGKAGGCGSAMADGIARLVSYGLRSGLKAYDAVNALSGISCHLGPKTCLNEVASAIRLVMTHLETGEEINHLIEVEEFADANAEGVFLPGNEVEIAKKAENESLRAG